MRLLLLEVVERTERKENRRVRQPEAIEHVGLLVIWPPSTAGVPFI
jgi:hypothetical protein